MPVTKTAARKAAKPAKKAAKKVTIDDVWAIIADIENIHKETEISLKTMRESYEKSRLEGEAVLKEMREANEKAHLEMQKSQKEMQKNLGGLGQTVGSIVEHIMTPDLPRKFRQFGFTFDKVTTVKWASNKTVYAEIDGLLENGAQAMVVEVKAKLELGDINEHIKRMEKVRKYADEHNDQREFYGALASTVTSKKAREYALSQGFYVIEPSGEDVKVLQPVSVKAKVW